MNKKKMKTRKLVVNQRKNRNRKRSEQSMENDEDIPKKNHTRQDTNVEGSRAEIFANKSVLKAISGRRLRNILKLMNITKEINALNTKKLLLKKRIND